MIHRLIQLLFLALLPSLVLAETVEQQQARVDRLEHPCNPTDAITAIRDRPRLSPAREFCILVVGPPYADVRISLPKMRQEL